MSLGTKVSLGVSSVLIMILVLSTFGFVSYQTSFLEKNLLERAEETLTIMEAMHTQAMLHRGGKSDHDPVISTLNKTFDQLSKTRSNMTLWFVMAPKVLAYQKAKGRLEREPPRDAVDREALASGRSVYRVAAGDIFRLTRPVVLGKRNARDPKCAACHGKDMGMGDGDVIGAYSIALSSASEQSNLDETERLAVIVSIFASLVIAIVCFFMIRRLATRPISEMTTKMGELAAGNLSLEIPYGTRSDEIGEMARSVLVFKENAIEKQHVEAQARQHEVELGHVLRRSTMGEMASALVHELAQPLATIATYSGTLVTKLKGGTNTGQEVFDVLEKINATAHRASQISRTIARHVRGTEPQRELINLRDLLDTISPLVDADAREIGAKFRLDLESSDAKVRVNATEIESVVLNLAHNSVEAMKEVDRKNRVLSIRTSVDGTDAVIAVTDTGNGMSPEARDRLFEPFFTTKSEGMGMGLAMCRTIVENHGGLFSVDPPTKQQTTIRFTLPLANREDDDDS